MSGMSSKLKKDADRKPDRKPYTPPRLREFGPVGALTQGGTGLSSEAGPSGMGMAMAGNKRA